MFRVSEIYSGIYEVRFVKAGDLKAGGFYEKEMSWGMATLAFTFSWVFARLSPCLKHSTCPAGNSWCRCR